MTAISSLSRTCAVALASAALLSAPLAVSDAQEASSGVAQVSNKWGANFTGTMGAQIRVEPAKKENESQARLEVLRGGSNSLIAWDIAEGVCGDNMQSIVPRAKFRQIQTGNDGSGSSRATIPRLVPGKRYYARVFSPDNPQVSETSTSSCVNLAEQP